MIRDVVIHTNEGLAEAPPELLDSNPPITGRVQIADDMWVGMVDHALAEAIIDSCDAPGRFVSQPVREFGQLYAFVRETAGEDRDWKWDHDARLQTCIALSRIVHPTSVSFRYAVRLMLAADGTVETIVPGPVRGQGAEAYVSPGPCRNWLIDADLEGLKELLAQYAAALLPERVRRALWYHEFAARTYYADVRWTLVTTAIEALVHTDRNSSTRQFIKRASRLAGDLGVTAFAEQDAGDAYDLRSALAHGQGCADLEKAKLALYERMETLLRACLRRCIQDPNFAAAFATDDTIRSRWPVSKDGV